MEISSKNKNSRYKYFHVIKLSTTSEKNQLDISSKIDYSRYKYFHRTKLGTASEKKENIAFFFIFFMQKILKEKFSKN